MPTNAQQNVTWYFDTLGYYCYILVSGATLRAMSECRQRLAAVGVCTLPPARSKRPASDGVQYRFMMRVSPVSVQDGSACNIPLVVDEWIQQQPTEVPTQAPACATESVANGGSALVRTKAHDAKRPKLSALQQLVPRLVAEIEEYKQVTQAQVAEAAAKLDLRQLAEKRVREAEIEDLTTRLALLHREYDELYALWERTDEVRRQFALQRTEPPHDMPPDTNPEPSP